MTRALTVAAISASLLAAGCSRPQPAPDAAAQPAQTQAVSTATKTAPSQSKVDAQRAELAQIGPPAKGRYISITSANLWQNPFIEVGVGTLKVTVLVSDANPSSIGQGGITRPAGARRTIEEIRPQDLGEMLADLPAAAWPYGRVVAVEESAQDARRDRVQMRRNTEATIQMLSNLGVVVDDWQEVGR